jgi:cellulose synthase/poly-beta-1,6-N-acetylglucosamine synthase-like glycosyltransferase
MNAIDIFLSLFILIYVLTLAVFAIGLIFYRSPIAGTSKTFASVLVAARNEEANIETCLRALFRQSYDPKRFEIIVIDDRSTDKTSEIVESLQEKFLNLRLITITETPKDMAPKKNALNEGIKVAKGEILVCTDADCRPEENWLAGMLSCFKSDVGMVVGYSPIEPKKPFSLMENFLALDSLALASIAAGSTAMGSTLTATGRSLAYRKEIFFEVGGFSKIARFVSGDDDLLMGLVKKTKWKIGYCIAEKALVFTDPSRSAAQFINQKIRQASKSMQYSLKMIAGLSLFYMFNLLIVLYLPWGFATAQSALQKVFYGSLFGIKFIIDFLILAAGAWRFGTVRYLRLYPIMALLYPFYVVIFGAWGLFGKFEWKDSKSKYNNL